MDQDIEKNRSLENLGYRVIRFREGELKKISKDDIEVPINNLSKIKINELLIKLKRYACPSLFDKIDQYISEDSFLNDTYYNEMVNVMPGALKEQSLGHLYPELLDTWDELKNDPISPFKIYPHTSQNLWWVCNKGHSWSAPPGRRIAGNGCPFCRGTYASDENNLEVNYPEIASSFHKSLNGNVKPNSVTPKSNKYFWWQCDKNPEHAWRAQVVSRTYKNAGCPYCSGNKLAPENTLAIKFPEIAAQWDFEKNDTTPDAVGFGSGRKVTWICSKGHSWEATITSRVQGRNCPICAGKKIIRETSLGFLHPELVKEMQDPHQIDVYKTSPGSHKKVTWKCAICELSYDANIRRRVGYGGKKPSGCPKCSKRNSLLNFKPNSQP